MAERDYLFSINLNSSFNKAVKGIKRALRGGGFEIVSEINFSSLIEDRLGIRVKKYLILETLNPFMAYQSLLTTSEAGLFVPFRMVIFEDRDGSVTVSLFNPEKMTGSTENMFFKLVTDEAWERLRETVGSLQ